MCPSPNFSERYQGEKIAICTKIESVQALYRTLSLNPPLLSLAEQWKDLINEHEVDKFIASARTMFDYDDVMTSRNHYLVFTLRSLVGATCVSVYIYIHTLVTVRAPEIFRYHANRNHPKNLQICWHIFC